eukprot:1189572-Prorocentrum_minimum.AAC.6
MQEAWEYSHDGPIRETLGRTRLCENGRYASGCGRLARPKRTKSGHPCARPRARRLLWRTGSTGGGVGNPVATLSRRSPAGEEARDVGRHGHRNSSTGRGEPRKKFGGGSNSLAAKRL